MNRWPSCVRGAEPCRLWMVVPIRLFTINELFLVIWSPLFLFRIRLLLVVAGCRLLAVTYTTCHVYFIVTLFFFLAFFFWSVLYRKTQNQMPKGLLGSVSVKGSLNEAKEQHRIHSIQVAMV